MGYEETDGDLLAAQAYEELAAEQEGREPKNLMSKPEEEDKEEVETQDTDSDEAKGIEEESTDEESNDEEAGDEETEDEESKPEEEDAEAPETQKEPEDEDAVITAHAEKHGMTYSEAKEDIEKTNKIIEQFKGDPKEMARALRSKDREYDKLKNESSKKEKESTRVFQRLSEDQFRAEAMSAINKDAEKFIQAYKSRYPAKSDLMSDEAMIEEIVDREWGLYQGIAAQEESKRTQQAVAAKSKIIADIPSEDRRFIPEVKAFVEQLNDYDVLHPDFDPSYFLLLAKGKRFDAEIKAAEERGAKRAKETPKILGVKGGGKSKSTSTSKGSLSLNDVQKHRAEEMFLSDDGYSPEKAHEMYIHTFKDELKKNPSFV